MVEQAFDSEEQNFHPHLKSKEVGSGTPLNDSLETPLYVLKGSHEPQVGIGPGTPLEEPDPMLVTTAETASAPPGETGTKASAPALAESLGPEEENFAEELAHSFETEPETGEVIKGKIIRIDAEGVIVDIGYKSEGFILREEFLDFAGQLHAQVGDEVEVLIERRENREGLLGLSKRKVDHRRAWNQAKTALANGNSLEGVIFNQCKGGFMVDLGGVKAFLPASQLDLRQADNPAAYLGKRYFFKVIKINQERGNIVISRRNHLLEERGKKRSEAIAKLTPGRLVHGIVKTLVNYGAFVDIGGVDALLHIKDMAWSKVVNPRQVVSAGDAIDVIILSIDEASGKIAVGLKQKNQDPWINLLEKYPVNSIVEGTVVTLTDFGAFLRLEEGVEGLLPVSELCWTKRVRHPKEILKVGDSVRVKVLASDPAAKKITLGLRQTEQDPFVVFVENHRAGEILKGTVKALAPFGAFVELAEGVSGLLHSADLSWDQNQKPSELLKVGDEVKVKILEVHAEKKKIALGLKQLGEDPWTVAAKKYPVGTVVKVKILRNTKFGTFVQMEPGIEGLIHVSQLEKNKNSTEVQPLPEGSLVEAKVVKVNWAEHKIGLSIREHLQDEEEAEMKKYLSPQNKPGISLAEVSGISCEELLKRVNEKANPV